MHMWLKISSFFFLPTKHPRHQDSRRSGSRLQTTLQPGYVRSNSIVEDRTAALDTNHIQVSDFSLHETALYWLGTYQAVETFHGRAISSDTARHVSSIA